jgi:type II secretory pathway pseudopilin PulG
MPRRAPRQSGFTYLTVLLVVAFMGLGLAKAGQVYRTTVLRDREAELLWVGGQYRRAIEGYYKNRDARYPRTLDDLLKDSREPSTRRYLRKRYPDPITGSEEWGLVPAPDGGIMGVYSRSVEQPFKVAGFTVANQAFEQAATYADWKFVYMPGEPGAALPVPQADTPLQPGLPEAARGILDATQGLRASMPPDAAPPPPPPASAYTPGAPPPRETDGPLDLRHE